MLLDFAIVKKLTVTYLRPQFDKPKEIQFKTIFNTAAGFLWQLIT